MTRTEQPPQDIGQPRLVDVDDDQDIALTPADGYFHETGSSVPDAILTPTSSQNEPDSKTNSPSAKQQYRENRSLSQRIENLNVEGEVPPPTYEEVSSAGDNFTPPSTAYAESNAETNNNVRNNSDDPGSSSAFTKPPIPIVSELPNSTHEPKRCNWLPGAFTFDEESGEENLGKKACGWVKKHHNEWRDRRARKTNFKRKVKISIFLAVMIYLCYWLTIWLFCPQRSHNRGHHHIPGDFKQPNYDDPNVSQDQRSIIVHEFSHSIRGTFPLYDLLDLSTSSGSIDVTIVPKPGNKTATLRIAGQSGSIRFRIDETALLDSHVNIRKFDTDIRGSSGSIKGSLIVGGGGSATLELKSGGLQIDVIPVNVSSTSPESFLKTQSSSGSMRINVKAPVGGGKISNLGALHEMVGSGSIDVRYPIEWEGQLSVTSAGSGSLKANVANFNAYRQDSREVSGWRGNRDGKLLKVNAIGSGSVRFSA